MKTHLLAATILTAMLNSAAVQAADADKITYEKCYGVAKASRNDCSAKDGSNSCAGRATKDANPNDWVYVPIGLCDKLANGVKG